MNKHLPALLLCLAACSSGERAPRPTRIDTALREAARFGVVAAAPRADSASICVQRFNGGLSVEATCTGFGLTPIVRVDTVRDTIPVAPSVVTTPLLSLSYECTAPTMRPLFTGCLRSAGAWTTGELASIKATGGKLILMQGGYDKFRNCGDGPACKLPGADKRYNSGKYRAWVLTLAPYVQSWQPYLADGTLLGAQVADDIGTGNWGGTAITRGQQDTMAMWWKQVVPGITTFTREKATGLTGYPWQYLDASITTYNGRYMGAIGLWRDSNYVAAKTAKLGLMLGVNVLGGGKVVPGCWHVTSTDPGLVVSCGMTPTELYTWGAIQLSTPGICGWVTWKLDPTYQAQPGVTDALKTLASLASLRSAPPCRRPT